MRTILCMVLLFRRAHPSACPVRLVCRISLCRSADRLACPSACPIQWVFCISLCCFLWQTCMMPLCMPRQSQIVLPYLTSLLLWQTCTPLCMPRQISLPYFTLSLPWLAVTSCTCSCCWLRLFSFSWDFDTAFAAAVQWLLLLHPPWYKPAMIQTES